MSDLNLKINKDETNEAVHHTPIFDLIENNNTGIVKIHAPNWVNVAVFNRDKNQWIYVKEHRHGIDKDVEEFMSGTVEEGETAKEAALREMEEELGYGIENVVHIEKLYELNTNPAFMDNKITGFFISVEGEPHNQHLDENEKVEIKSEYNFVDGKILDDCFKDNGIISELTKLKVRELLTKK